MNYRKEIAHLVEDLTDNYQQAEASFLQELGRRMDDHDIDSYDELLDFIVKYDWFGGGW